MLSKNNCHLTAFDNFYQYFDFPQNLPNHISWCKKEKMDNFFYHKEGTVIHNANKRSRPLKKLIIANFWKVKHIAEYKWQFQQVCRTLKPIEKKIKR